MSETIRSFIAFDLDNETLLKKFAYVQSLILKTGADVKIVEPENIHITLHFLGNISAEAVGKIYAEMTKIQFSAFDVKICGLGAFPNVNYPRVVWAGIISGVTELKSVFDQLEPKLQGLGFHSEARGLSPHLTIARVRSGRNKESLADLIRTNGNYEFGKTSAECLRLKKSQLTPKGPIYSTLKEFCPEKQN